MSFASIVEIPFSIVLRKYLFIYCLARREKILFFLTFLKQILAVNGTSLLNLPYADSLRILQNTGKTVELIVSQVHGKIEMEATATDTSGTHEGNKVYVGCKVPEVDNGNENQQSLDGSMETIGRQPQIKINQNMVVDDVNFKNDDNTDCLKRNDDSYEPTEITRQKDENKDAGYLELGSAGYAAGYRKLCDISLMSAKSMPDLPKVCVCNYRMM